MARRLLAVTMSLGLVVTGLGFTGVFALFSDRATVGPNSADSGERRVADLQLAPWEQGACGTFADDLTTPSIDATGLQPGGDLLLEDYRRYCIRNSGSSSLDLTMSVIELTDTEIGCSTEEALVENTCGSPGDGELSQVLTVSAFIACGWDVYARGDLARLVDLATTPQEGFGSMAPGDTLCLGLGVHIPDATFPAAWLAAAQTDQSTWRFAFDGTAP